SALYFMYSFSILLCLTGLTIIVIDYLLADQRAARVSNPLSDFSEAQRTGFAMIVSGLAIGLFHLVYILGFTNNRSFPATRRVFLGWRLAINSLVVLIAFTVLLIQVFQTKTTFDDLKTVFGTLLVWGPSWLI